MNRETIYPMSTMTDKAREHVFLPIREWEVRPTNFVFTKNTKGEITGFAFLLDWRN
jgi:hypothetical protein